MQLHMYHTHVYNLRTKQTLEIVQSMGLWCLCHSPYLRSTLTINRNSPWQSISCIQCLKIAHTYYITVHTSEPEMSLTELKIKMLTVLHSSWRLQGENLFLLPASRGYPACIPGLLVMTAIGPPLFLTVTLLLPSCKDPKFTLAHLDNPG